MKRLSRAQRIAALAGLAFVFYVFGGFLVSVVFYGGFGWIAYSPGDRGVDWTYIWQSAVRFGIYVGLASLWTLIAIRSLRPGPHDGPGDESRTETSPDPNSAD